MASKRNKRRRSCEGKKKFSKEAAILARKAINKKQIDKISYYKCKFCGSYHIGHVGSMVKRRIISVMKNKVT